MKTGQVILSRLLPKTGRETSEEAGDDGAIEAGWWKGLTFAANRSRFIVLTIGSDKVVIDRATGLMWARDCTAAGGDSGSTEQWRVHLAYANALDFAGFTDWRMPNILEFISIVDFSLGGTGWYGVFLNTIAARYWTSTGSKPSPTEYYGIVHSTGLVTSEVGIFGNYNLICVRGGV